MDLDQLQKRTLFDNWLQLFSATDLRADPARRAVTMSR